MKTFPRVLILLSMVVLVAPTQAELFGFAKKEKPGKGQQSIETQPSKEVSANISFDLTYKFANGASIGVVVRGENAGIYFLSEKMAPKIQLFRGNVYEVPEDFKGAEIAGTLSKESALSDFNQKAVALVAGGLMRIVTQDGKIVSLKNLAPLSPCENLCGSIFYKDLGDYEYGGHRYFVIKLNWQMPVESAGRNLDSEIYVVREDGVAVRAWLGYKDSKHSIEISSDGIMGNSNFYRRLDLDRFEMEPFFMARIHNTVLSGASGEGKSAHNGREFVRSFTTPVPANPEFRLQDLTSGQTESLNKALRTIRNTNKSVVLTGPSGVGKSHVLNAMAFTLPRTWEIRKVTPTDMTSGAEYTGRMSERISSMRAVSSYYPVIWAFDELSTFEGLGTHRSNPNDVLDMILGDLAEGRMRIAATDTIREFSRLTAKRPQIGRRFQKIALNAPTRLETIEILKRDAMEDFQYSLDSTQLEGLLRISEHFDPFTEEPSRTSSFMRTVLDEVLTSGKGEFTEDVVKRAVKSHYNVPDIYVDPSMALEKLMQLPAFLDEVVVGNNRAKRAIFNQLALSIMDTYEKTLPRFMGALFGPRGTGKTEIAKGVAQYLETGFERIMMSDYSGPFDSDAFLSRLGQFIQANPFAVVLLDEPEKASKEVQNALLQALDSKQFSFTVNNSEGNSESRNVNVGNVHFIFASNAAQNFVMNRYRDGASFTESELEEAAIADGLSEFLSDRLHFLSAMLPLDNDERLQLIETLLQAEIVKQGATLGSDEIASMVQEMMRETEGNLSNRDTVRVVRGEVSQLITKRRMGLQDADEAAGAGDLYDACIELMKRAGAQ